MFCIRTNYPCSLMISDSCVCYCPSCQAYKWFSRALRFFSSENLAEMYKTLPPGPTHKHLRVAILDAKIDVECPF